MDALIVLHVAAALMLFPTITVAALPNGQCFVEEMTCQIDDTNLIGFINGVMTSDDCKQECEDSSSDCKIYSYYGQEGIPFFETCLLFNDCTILNPAVDCVTEDIECSLFCNAPVEGRLGENLIKIVPDVTDADCEVACEAEEQCLFFTYHYANSTPYPRSCFLLTEIQGPLSPCQEGTCITASSKCESDACGFFDDSTFYSNGILINETKTIDLLAMGPCSIDATILAVAVGGGGSAGADAGAGSGYVEFIEFGLPGNLTLPYLQLQATVGAAGQSSELTVNGSTVLTASPGGDAFQTNGGPGYSGGGADWNGCSGGCPSGDGGTDGSDGGDSNTHAGGQGSGFDIGTIPLTHFELR